MPQARNPDPLVNRSLNAIVGPRIEEGHRLDQGSDRPGRDPVGVGGEPSILSGERIDVPEPSGDRRLEARRLGACGHGDPQGLDLFGGWLPGLHNDSLSEEKRERQKGPDRGQDPGALILRGFDQRRSCAPCPLAL